MRFLHALGPRPHLVEMTGMPDRNDTGTDGMVLRCVRPLTSFNLNDYPFKINALRKLLNARILTRQAARTIIYAKKNAERKDICNHLKNYTK